MEILLLLMPGIIGVSIYKKMNKNEWSIWKYIEVYAIITFLIHVLNGVLLYLRGWEDYSISTMGISAQIKYGILSIIFAVGLPILMWGISKGLSLKKYAFFCFKK